LNLDPARPPVALVIRQFSAATAPDQRLPLVKRYPAPPDAVPRVWVSEAFVDLYRERLGLDVQQGGTFELPLPLNARQVAAQRVRVAGIWRDYSRQHGTVLMEWEDYARITGDARAHDAALWLSVGYSADAVLAAIKSRLPDQPALEIAVSTEVRALSLKVFDRTFAVTYALEAVAVVIGLAGMAAAFMGQVVVRRKELGMLRHLGLTRAELIQMITLEGAALAALGALLGLLLGLILAAVLVFVINPQSFGWSMDFHIPAPQLAGFAAIWVLVAAGAAWLTARRVLGTQDLVRSVREDW
jgi:putative ABC transport system permease protein